MDYQATKNLLNTMETLLKMCVVIMEVTPEEIRQNTDEYLELPEEVKDVSPQELAANLFPDYIPGFATAHTMFNFIDLQKNGFFDRMVIVDEPQEMLPQLLALVNRIGEEPPVGHTPPTSAYLNAKDTWWDENGHEAVAACVSKLNEEAPPFCRFVKLKDDPEAMGYEYDPELDTHNILTDYLDLHMIHGGRNA